MTSEGDRTSESISGASPDACESKQLLRQRALSARASLSAEMRHQSAIGAVDQMLRLLEERGLLGLHHATDTQPTPETRTAIAHRSAGSLVVVTYATHGHEFPAEPVFDEVRAAAAHYGDPAVIGAYPRVSGPGELTFHQCERADLVEGYRGILEPPADAPVIDPSEVDLVLVPGVAFDERAMRLGYGKGFYDRALSSMAGALKVGLSFEETLFADVPCESHDFPLDAVITPTRTVSAPEAR